MTTNERLKELRARFHLTRRELAEIIGVAQTTIDRWLMEPSGEGYRRISRSNLRLLELELGVATISDRWAEIRARHRREPWESAESAGSSF